MCIFFLRYWLQIRDVNNNSLSLLVAGSSSSESVQPSISKSIYKASGTTSLTAFYDTSIDVINNNFSTEITNNVSSGVAYLDGTRVGTTIYACYVMLNDEGENDSIVLVSSKDDGNTFTTPVVLRSSASPISSDACNIEGLQMPDGSVTIGVILMGTEKTCEGDDCSISTQAIVSTDGGANFGSAFDIPITLNTAERNAFPFSISSSGVMYGAHREDSSEVLIAFNSTGVLSTTSFAQGTAASGAYSRALANGSNVDVVYEDDRFESGGLSNVVVTAFINDSGTLTQGNTFQVTTSSDCTSDVTSTQAFLDRNGDVEIFWLNPDTSEAVLSRVDVSEDPTSSSAVTDYLVDSDCTAVSTPGVSYANHINLFYLKGWNGYFRVGAFSSEDVLTFSDAQYVDISEVVPVMHGSADFTSPDGRFYNLYNLTTGSVSIARLVLIQ